MSKVIILTFSPGVILDVVGEGVEKAKRAVNREPTIPPAGPESIHRTLARPASARLNSPPFDCIILNRTDILPPDSLFHNFSR
jgi:hypothetical protein